MKQDTNFFDVIKQEFLLSLLLGGAPVLIAFEMGGVVGIEKELSGLIPSDLVLWWSVGLTFF